jgi:DNA helicase-2/ATP-dependent DNA helicase PcrA
MSFSERYRNLNTQQKQAVDCLDGPVMVIAGPGTGKTELLSMRAANILQKTDTLPENILCLTFTESGATAMRQRLYQIIGAAAYKVAIHTFHSFGTEIINHNSEFFYGGADFKPADDLSCYEILRTIFDGLDYDNPLAGKTNGEYTHLSDTLTVISELKKSGLTSDELLLVLDANDRVIESAEPQLAEIFSQRISKTTTAQLADATTHILKSDVSIPLPSIPSLARVLADDLSQAVEAATDTNSTKPITAWRNAWLKKNDAGNFILKARDRQTKLRSVSFIYYQYIARMQEAQLFDFDDMIMQVVHAMEVTPELSYNLQEQYLYIMVDEFQDTNLAQMRILYNLTNSAVNEGRPNILVVGDDDQAIYSFQGADVGNINGFRASYDQTQLIVLTDNYRSTEAILHEARSVISMGGNRLENIIEELDKTLTPHYKNQASRARLTELPTSNDERQWLVDSIATAIKAGTNPSDIAVIARRHHELQALLPYFAQAGLSVNYERRNNVLDIAIIKLVEHIARIAVALFEKRHDEANALLPELLAHPSFNIPATDVWKLSLSAHRNRQGWLEVMATTPELMPLLQWLVELSQQLSHQPLEQLLDRIIGLPLERQGSDSVFDDADDTISTNETPKFVSPLFGYFFSAEKLVATPDTYLTYLEALRTIRTKLRDYQPNETPTLQSFLEFIRLHRQLGSPITSVRPGSERITAAVNLMTAHKSKGLEFDTVYIVGAVDSAWGERVRTKSRLISYPENLRLAPSGDTFDERLRLFFVAMTRARAHLFISYSLGDDSGKTMLRASFLAGDSWNVETPTLNTTVESLTHAAELAWYQPIIEPMHASMKNLLAPQLETYKLSSTHLNNFLDITRGGPHGFLLNNLLRFPQAMNASAGYGSAIHAALQRAHTHLVATGKSRPLEDILHDFEESLQNTRLSEADFAQYLQKGSDALTAFMDAKQSTFTTTQKAELSFAHQNVRIGDVHLTGSLDLVDINPEDRTIIVTDYKTGKAPSSWTGKTDYEKIKLHKYRQQLMFYNLLTMHSRDYTKYIFEKGILQFVEPTPNGDILALEATFSNEELERFTQLLMVVWRKITTFDLPNTNEYEQSYKGMLAFEEDLLADLS